MLLCHDARFIKVSLLRFFVANTCVVRKGYRHQYCFYFELFHRPYSTGRYPHLPRIAVTAILDYSLQSSVLNNSWFVFCDSKRTCCSSNAALMMASSCREQMSGNEEEELSINDEEELQHHVQDEKKEGEVNLKFVSKNDIGETSNNNTSIDNYDNIIESLDEEQYEENEEGLNGTENNSKTSSFFFQDAQNEKEVARLSFPLDGSSLSSTSSSFSMLPHNPYLNIDAINNKTFVPDTLTATPLVIVSDVTTTDFRFSVYEKVASLLGRTSDPRHVQYIYEQIAENNVTIPFLARYHTDEVGGSFSEARIELIYLLTEQILAVEKMKNVVLKTIKSKKLLTKDLEAKLNSCIDMPLLEELYLPYQPRQDSRAEVARTLGMENLCERLLKNNPEDFSDLLPEVIEMEKGEGKGTPVKMTGARLNAIKKKAHQLAMLRKRDEENQLIRDARDLVSTTPVGGEALVSLLAEIMYQRSFKTREVMSQMIRARGVMTLSIVKKQPCELSDPEWMHYRFLYNVLDGYRIRFSRVDPRQLFSIICGIRLGVVVVSRISVPRVTFAMMVTLLMEEFPGLKRASGRMMATEWVRELFRAMAEGRAAGLKKKLVIKKKTNDAGARHNGIKDKRENNSFERGEIGGGEFIEEGRDEKEEYDIIPLEKGKQKQKKKKDKKSKEVNKQTLLTEAKADGDGDYRIDMNDLIDSVSDSFFTGGGGGTCETSIHTWRFQKSCLPKCTIDLGHLLTCAVGKVIIIDIFKRQKKIVYRDLLHVCFHQCGVIVTEQLRAAYLQRPYNVPVYSVAQVGRFRFFGVALDAAGNPVSRMMSNAKLDGFNELRNSIYSAAKIYKIKHVVLNSSDVTTRATMEMRGMVRKMVRQINAGLKLPADEGISISVMSNRGGRSYAVLPSGIEEFPRITFDYKTSIWCGRMIQDRMPEFTKSSLKSIFFENTSIIAHGLDYKLGNLELRMLLESNMASVMETINSIIASVGVPIGLPADGSDVSGNQHLLRAVPGMPLRVARAIFENRDKIKKRSDLLRVPGMTIEIFRKVAGFLKIANVNCPEPLDRTRIHPDLYVATYHLLGAFGCDFYTRHVFFEQYDEAVKQVVEALLKGREKPAISGKQAWVSALERKAHKIIANHLATMLLKKKKERTDKGCEGSEKNKENTLLTSFPLNDYDEQQQPASKTTISSTTSAMSSSSTGCYAPIVPGSRHSCSLFISSTAEIKESALRVRITPSNVMSIIASLRRTPEEEYDPRLSLQESVMTWGMFWKGPHMDETRGMGNGFTYVDDPLLLGRSEKDSQNNEKDFSETEGGANKNEQVGIDGKHEEEKVSHTFVNSLVSPIPYIKLQESYTGVVLDLFALNGYTTGCFYLMDIGFERLVLLNAKRVNSSTIVVPPLKTGDIIDNMKLRFVPPESRKNVMGKRCTDEGLMLYWEPGRTCIRNEAIIREKFRGSGRETKLKESMAKREAKRYFPEKTDEWVSLLERRMVDEQRRLE